MPNGGPDCCGNCGYNKAVQEKAPPHPEFLVSHETGTS